MSTARVIALLFMEVAVWVISASTGDAVSGRWLRAIALRRQVLGICEIHRTNI